MQSQVVTAPCVCGCTAEDRPTHPEGYNPGSWAPIDAWLHHHYAIINRADTRCAEFLDHCHTLLTENLLFAGKVGSIANLTHTAIAGIFTTWRALAEMPTGHVLKVRVHWRILVNVDHTIVVKCGVGVEGGGSIFLSRVDDTLQAKADEWLIQAQAIREMLSTAHHTRRFIIDHAATQRGLREAA